jgi:hypothetical protein
MGCCGGGLGFGRRGSPNRDPEPDPITERDVNPESALKLRLARGEITVEEYRSLLDVLRAPTGPSVAAR